MITTSGLLISMHGVISLPDARSSDVVYNIKSKDFFGIWDQERLILTSTSTESSRNLENLAVDC